MDESGLLTRLRNANNAHGFADRAVFSAALDGTPNPQIPRSGIADVAFAAQLNYVLSQMKEKEPERIERLSELDELVAVDLGCGSIPYRKPLALVLASINPNVALYGIDKNSANWGPYEERIGDTTLIIKKGNIEELHKWIAGFEKEKVDVLLAYNPSPNIPFPRLKKIAHRLVENAILIGSADGITWGSAGHYDDGLKANDYSAIVTEKNPFGTLLQQGYSDPASSKPHRFSPWYGAVRGGN